MTWNRRHGLLGMAALATGWHRTPAAAGRWPHRAGGHAHRTGAQPADHAAVHHKPDDCTMPARFGRVARVLCGRAGRHPVFADTAREPGFLA